MQGCEKPKHIQRLVGMQVESNTMLMSNVREKRYAPPHDTPLSMHIKMQTVYYTQKYA